jgi:hypothetical protein
MTPSLRRFLCILALAGITACSGGNAPAPLAPSSLAQQAVAVNALATAPSTPICVDPLIAPAPKIFEPAPGSTNVSTAPGKLIVGSSLERYHVPFVGLLTPTSGGASVSTSPLEPHGKRRASASYPQLAAGTTYEIRFESARGAPCLIWTPSVKGFTTAGTLVTPPPTATPTFCPVVDPVPEGLLSPVSGATNVSPNIGVIVVYGTPIVRLTLTPPSGAAIDTSTIVPPPNGITATPYGPPIGFRIPTLAPGTTYQVTAHYLPDPAFPNCPNPAFGLGSFTTAQGTAG